MEHACFHGLPLLTAPGAVMTPRPATEQLVTAAAARSGPGFARVADVGTGSGAIAVALALAAPRAEIWASDVSPAAVLLARANAHRFGVEDRVHVVRGDLLEELPGGLDLIVANLPYLPRGEDRPELAGEPEQAVYADGNGLGLYRRLLAEADGKLRPDGTVLIQLHRRVLDLDPAPTPEAPRPACHAGGRGLESRRSRLSGNACMYAFMLPVPGSVSLCLGQQSGSTPGVRWSAFYQELPANGVVLLAGSVTGGYSAQRTRVFRQQMTSGQYATRPRGDCAS